MKGNTMTTRNFSAEERTKLKQLMSESILR